MQGKSQGYGFVIFKNLEDAENAVGNKKKYFFFKKQQIITENMDKTVFNGRELNVRLWT